MRALIVDDEPSIRRMLRRLLQTHGHQVCEAGSAEEALAAVSSGSPDVVLLDLQLPGRSGLEVLPELRVVAPAARVVMMTAHGTIASAVQAMRHGAWDYLTKPFDNDELLARIGRIEEVQRLGAEVEALRSELESRYGLTDLVGSSPAMAAVLATIRKVAPTTATVLVQGESGTGKELVARAIHRISPRTGRFVAINCGAIPQQLVEDAFFGHVRGAFTDARGDRPGAVEQAAGGTLFLDEIVELPGDAQATLLRLLQERTYTPVGGDRERSADLRVIAASNIDLGEAVRSGRFREDLYWRLEGIAIHVPPLRDRIADLPALVDHLLEKRAHELAVPLRPLEPAALELLGRYPWPGNVRELENVLYRALVLADGATIGVGDLPPRIRGTESPAVPADDALPLAELVERFEGTVIRDRLREHDGNRTLTAESLGISRKTLFNKMRRSGLSDTDTDTDGED